MAFSPSRAFGKGAFLTFCAVAGAAAQEKPLARTFLGGTVETYRVHVTLRVDVHDVVTQTVGEKAYVKPSTHSAEALLEWTSTRKIGGVVEGTAQITETLTPTSAQCERQRTSDPESQKLQDSLNEVCSILKEGKTFRYQERPDGLIRDLPVDSAPSLGEHGPPLLTLWLRRSLRPSVIFPPLPFHPGARSQHPIVAPSGMTGSETTEWIDAGGDSSAASLHVVQELSWPEPPGERGVSNVGGLAPGKTTFFADSSTTVSLLDGSVSSSTRTATRETRHVLNPVEGLPQPPEFSSKLTIVVTIRRIS
jgi:hypothetical protein